MIRHPLRAVLPVLLLVPGALLWAGPARADAGESIGRYTIELATRADGSMHVREAITYTFAGSEHHGIERFITTQFEHGEGEIRQYPVSHVEVTSPTGAPDDVDVDGGAVTTIRIGDPDETVRGTQRYELNYDVGGVTNTLADHQELYWNVIGTQWDVPISNVSVTMSGPAAVTKTACFEGAQGSTDTCDSSVGGGGKAVFSAPQLQPNQGMTVVGSFPTGTFPDAEPIIKEKQTLGRAFTLDPATGLGSLALFGVIGGGAAALVSRRGRDERYLATVPGLEPGLGQDTGTTRASLFSREPVAVQFTPPKDVRPGQIGTLIDEQANVLDVTATIVDLAVRGFLKIEEIPKEGWFGKADWRLRMVWPAPTDELTAYETTLLQAIFKDRQEVLMSELKQHFSTDLKKVQSQLYDDVTLRGWFRGNPSSVRVTWTALAVVLVLAGGGLTFLLATRTRFGLIGIAVLAAGLVALVLAPRMPARTARGTAVLAQTRGFRQYLETAEANQLRFEEGEDIFSRYLPYAIIFGVAERWAKVFADLAAGGARVAEPTWYAGSAFNQGVFNYALFAGSMDDFTTTTSGSIAAATPSSSGGSGFGGGGFSGGGGGGGGGGSW